MNTPNRESTATPDTAPPDNLIPLPIGDHLLPPGSPVRMTPALWHALAGADAFHPRDVRLDDLCFYLTFALLGMIGFDRESSPAADTLLVPVAFASGKSVMRVTLHRQPGNATVLTLSLPKERITFPEDVFDQPRSA